MESREVRSRAVAPILLLIAGVLSLGLSGCAGAGGSSVGGGIVFTNAVAGDMGGELKVVFADFDRTVVEYGRDDSERFMIDVEPVWSPDGKKLAFSRTNAEHEEVLYVKTRLGRAGEKAKELGFIEGAPVWSPSSDKIAFLEVGKGGMNFEQQFEAEERGESEAEHPKEPEGGSEAESGKEKADTGEKGSRAEGNTEGASEAAHEEEAGEVKPVGLTVIGDGGENRTLLVPGKAEPIGWSDSDAVYYVSGASSTRDLRLVSAGGGGDRLVYAPSGRGDYVAEAVLSPDFRSMAMEIANASEERSRLLVRDLKTGRTRTLARGADMSGLSWCPDGNRIALFLSGADGKTGHVMVVGTERGGVTVVTESAGAYRSPTWCSDGKSVAYVKNGDIYIQTLGTGRVRRLTRSGDVASIRWSPL